MDIQEVFNRAKKGGIVWRSGGGLHCAKDVSGISTTLGVNFPHLVIGVYDRYVPESYIREDFQAAGFSV